MKSIKKKIVCAILLSPILGSSISCQIHQDFDFCIEMALGKGNYTGHYLISNRNGVLSPQANTGYCMLEHQTSCVVNDWIFNSGIDIQYTANSQHYSSLNIHQLYVQAKKKNILFRIGSKEITPLLRDYRLSSGSTCWSGNARPIPGVYIGLDDYKYFPGTRHLIQFLIDGSYGYFADSNYLEDEYNKYISDKTNYGKSFITTQVWFHQKRAILRTCPNNPLVFTISCEHFVQFGGKTNNSIDSTNNGSFWPDFKDYFLVLVPVHGDDSANTGDQKFVYGNHIGNYSLLMEYKWGKKYYKKIGLYVENLFEDGSGLRKANRMDGLWGIEYHNRKPRAFVKGFVMEYLQTTDQSGPIHWAPSDFEGQEIASVAHQARGADDYYNNFFYTGYSHFGMACGSPMIKSPILNEDHYLRFTDNRIMAWHMGLEGCLCQYKHRKLDYRVLVSYRQSWGTYFDPAKDVRTNTSGCSQLIYTTQRFNYTFSYAFDKGSLIGSNQSFGFRINYHISR